MNADHFAPLLQRALVQRGMTNRQLAAVVDVSANTVSSWRTGSHLPSTRHLVAIATALDVELNELTGPAAQITSPDLAEAHRRSAAIVHKLAQIDAEPVLEAIARATPDLLEIIREATDYARHPGGR